VEQLPHPQVPAGPGRAVAGPRRRPPPDSRLRSLCDQRRRPLRQDGHHRRSDAGRPCQRRAPPAGDLPPRRSAGRTSVNRFVEVLATEPARIMGLYPQKGTLAVANDADIVVLDPNQTWTVHHQDLHMSADYSCWDGWELHGRSSQPSCVARCWRTTAASSAGKAGRFLPRTLPNEVTSPQVRLEPARPAACGRASMSSRMRRTSFSD
jgi:hypothetical protein